MTHLLPPKLRPLAAEATFAAKDALDALLRRRPPLVPPRRLMFDGPRDPALFVQNGREFLQHYIELCDLQPHERVLDIGSGIGRKAVPLIDFLDERGSYTGFDINRTGVAWCRERIGSRHPNFTFQHIDVYNGRYNPSGTTEPSAYTFPLDSAQFDFVVLTSVFTHMFPPEVAQYLREVGRLLRPGGRALISFFLRNAESAALIERGQSSLHFPHERKSASGAYAIERESVPEDAVAFDEALVRRFYDESGLNIRTIHYGTWCGRAEGVSYQDLVVAHKL